MYTTINKSNFRDAFQHKGRGDQFSYKALGALFDWFEEYENAEIEIELDVIAICCDWCEYDDLDEVKAVYIGIESLEDLQNHTIVIELDGGGLVVMNV